MNLDIFRSDVYMESYEKNGKRIPIKRPLVIGPFFADNWNSARTRRVRVMRLREFSTPELLAEVPIKDEIPNEEEWEKARQIIAGFVT